MSGTSAFMSLTKRTIKRPHFFDDFELDDHSDENITLSSMSDEYVSSTEGESEEEEETQPISEEGTSIDSSNDQTFTSGSKADYFTWKKVGPKMNGKEKKFIPSTPYGFNSSNNMKDADALDFFFEYLSLEFWEKVVEFSNSRQTPKSNYILTLPNLLRYLSVCMYHGALRMRAIHKIWKKGTIFYNKKVASVLKEWEFSAIGKILRVSEDPESNINDNLRYIRTMAEELNNNCRTKFNPGKNISLDEASMGFSGKTKNINRTRHKKKSSSFQAFAICDDATAFLLGFEFVFDNIASLQNDNSINKTQNAVLRILDPFKGHWYWVIMDNYYTSPRLMLLLADLKFYAFGTWKHNLGMPDMLNQKKVSLRNLEAAREQPPIVLECQTRTIAQVEQEISPLWGTSFYCNSVVKFLTSLPFDMSKRLRGGQKNKLKYLIQHLYNEYMNGVDVFDALVSYYTTYFKCSKAWKRLFFWMLDAALVNGFISQSPFLRKEISHVDYIINVADQLVLFAEALEMKIEEESETAETMFCTPATWYFTQKNQHADIRLNGTHKCMKSTIANRCVLCRKNTKAKKTRSFCTTCQKPICSVHWNDWHKEHDLSNHFPVLSKRNRSKK